MSEEERAQLAIQLVRFLAILYAEILRMLQMVDQDEVTVLLQMPVTATATPPSQTRLSDVPTNSSGCDSEPLSLMQATDRFGVLLQQLLGLLEKMGQPLASVRSSFLMSILADFQRPGTHVSAVVIDKMDRLQALLLSFDEGVKQEMQDEDRDWCLRQWDMLRPLLLDKKREQGTSAQQAEQASSSSEIVFLEDSQEPTGDCASQVAVLANGTTRPLTEEEIAEIAYRGPGKKS